MKKYLLFIFVILSCINLKTYGLDKTKQKKKQEPVTGSFHIVNDLDTSDIVEIKGANIGKYTKKIPDQFKNPKDYDIYNKHAAHLIGEEISDTKLMISKNVTYLRIQIGKNFYTASIPKNIPDGITLYLVKKEPKKKPEEDEKPKRDMKKPTITYLLKTKKEDAVDDKKKKKAQKQISITLKQAKAIKKEKEFTLPEIMLPTFAIPEHKTTEEIDLSSE